MTVNGQERSAEVEPRLLLVHLLRFKLGLTGTHVGCDTTSCGACTVLLDGRRVLSCLSLAVARDGAEVVTADGLTDGDGALHPVQQAFLDAQAQQCGFCTPGFLATTVELLDRNAKPSEAEIRAALAGNTCRCTGYQHIVDAVVRASEAAS